MSRYPAYSRVRVTYQGAAPPEVDARTGGDERFESVLAVVGSAAPPRLNTAELAGSEVEEDVELNPLRLSAAVTGCEEGSMK